MIGIDKLIVEAYEMASSEQCEYTDKKKLHNERSRKWIAALHQQFVKQYSSETDVRVFSKGNKDNWHEFLLNELLFDISVCQVATVPSAKHHKELTYIKKALWQVESEFARNSRETMKDFSKLVTGSADNKLFVGSHVSDDKAFMDVLLPAAAVCSGTVYLALLPHPSTWDSIAKEKPFTWKFVNGLWFPVSGAAK